MMFSRVAKGLESKYVSNGKVSESMLDLADVCALRVCMCKSNRERGTDRHRQSDGETER